MSLSFGQMHGIGNIRNRFNWVEVVRWTALPERPWCEWGVNIKMGIRKTGCALDKVVPG
jgi:hypothetical protein